MPPPVRSPHGWPSPSTARGRRSAPAWRCGSTATTARTCSPAHVWRSTRPNRPAAGLSLRRRCGARSPSGFCSSPPTRPPWGCTPSAIRLRRCRAPLPAGGEVGRGRRRRGRPRRVRLACLRGLPSLRARASGAPHRRPAERTHRHGLPPAHSPGVCARWRGRGRAVPGGDRRAGVVLAYRLALRVVPDPWALGAAAAVGLSPPLLAYSSAVYPEPAAVPRSPAPR